MIPSEVTDMCKVMEPDFDNLHPDDQAIYLEYAWALYNAGYRKIEQ